MMTLYDVRPFTLTIRVIKSCVISSEISFHDGEISNACCALSSNPGKIMKFERQAETAQWKRGSSRFTKSL